MKPTTDVQVQLATRVPKGLLRDCKLTAIRTEQTLTAFVEDALRAKLAKGGK